MNNIKTPKVFTEKILAYTPKWTTGMATMATVTMTTPASINPPINSSMPSMAGIVDLETSYVDPVNFETPYVSGAPEALANAEIALKNLEEEEERQRVSLKNNISQKNRDKNGRIKRKVKLSTESGNKEKCEMMETLTNSSWR